MKRYIIAIIILFHFLASADAPAGQTQYLEKIGAESLSFDRADFGNTDLPLWYNLSQFEAETIKRVESGIDNPDLLLSLALIASGDTRTDKEFRKYLNVISNFVDKIRTEVNSASSVKEKGKIVFNKMHGEFLSAGNESDSLSNYDLNQSSFSEVLDSGRYNCISSSILYIILARHFDLEVVGVRLPTHVFVQLTTPSGDVVEAETTSPSGYGLTHDREFYESAAGEWAGSRDLPEPEFSEYQNRIIEQPCRLIIYNMINQHIAELQPEDRLRLVEIRGYLDFKNREALLDRIKLYLMEYNYLSDSNDCNSVIRMHNAVEQDLARATAIYPDQAEIINTVSFLETNIAYCMAENGDTERPLDLLDGVLDRVFQDSNYGPESFSNAATVINNIIIYLLESGKQTEAGNILEKYSGLFERPDIGRKSVIRFCRNMAKWCFAENKWAEAVEHLNRCLSISESIAESGQEIRDNLLFAYFNWGVSGLRAKDWEGAIGRFERALEYSAGGERQEKILKNLSIAYFNYGSGANFEKGEEFIRKYGKECSQSDWYVSNAISFYSNWAGALANSGSWPEGIAKLEIAADLAGDGEEEISANISNRMSTIYLDWGNHLIDRKEYEKAAEKFSKSLELAGTENQRAAAVKNLSLARVRYAVENGDYQSAEQFIDQYGQDFSQYEGYAKNAVWFYSSWANRLLKQKKLAEGIEKLKERLKYIDRSNTGDIRETRGYIRDTYINWSFDYLERGEWEKSLEILSRAMEWADTEDERDDVAEYIFNCCHQWALYYLERGETGKALDTYRECREEYPICEDKCLIEEERIRRAIQQ